jgi:hypothetical protein
VTDMLVGTAAKTTTDEENYDTLKSVRNILQEAVQGLYKDFNGFNVLKDTNKKQALENLLFQVEGKQAAYDILAPILESIISAMQTVDNKYKQR